MIGPYTCCYGSQPEPRYTTFNDIFKRRWSDILKFRAKSLFTTCEVCSVLKEQLADRTLGVEAKLIALQHYRAHLHSQYADRTCMWQLQSQSSEPHCEVIFIATDGLDQAKFALPRRPGLKANAAVCFGYGLVILVDLGYYVVFWLILVILFFG